MGCRLSFTSGLVVLGRCCDSTAIVGVESTQNYTMRLLYLHPTHHDMHSILFYSICLTRFLRQIVVDSKFAHKINPKNNNNYLFVLRNYSSLMHDVPTYFSCSAVSRIVPFASDSLLFHSRCGHYYSFSNNHTVRQKNKKNKRETDAMYGQHLRTFFFRCFWLRSAETISHSTDAHMNNKNNNNRSTNMRDATRCNAQNGMTQKQTKPNKT